VLFTRELVNRHAQNISYLPQPRHATTLGDTNAGKSLWFNALDYYFKLENKNYTSDSSTSEAERNHVQAKQDPAWLELDETTPDATCRTRKNTQTIKMNDYLAYSRNSSKFLKITNAQRKNLGRIVAYVDGQGHDTPSVTTGNTYDENFSTTHVLVGLRHKDGANISLLDGHSSHQVNAISQNGNGCRSWYSESPTNESRWPDAIFDFRSRTN